MPYIGSDIMKQWKRHYKYLLRVQQEHGTLRPEQQIQWEFLAPIFEVGGSNEQSVDLGDHRSSGIR
jgi:hypothetical protein